MGISKELKFYKRDILDKQIDIKSIVICSMLCIYPLIDVKNTFGYFTFPRYVMLCILSLLCLLELIKGENIKFKWVHVPLLLYLACVIISSITSVNSQTAWLGLFGYQFIPSADGSNELSIIKTNRYTGFITIIFCIIMYITACKKEKRDKYISGMIICATLVGFIAVLQHFGINIVTHPTSSDGWPPYATIGQHNFLATYTVFILPAAIYKFIKSKNKLWLPCIALIYAGLFVSTTRGAWMALGISMVIMFIYYIRKIQFRKSFIIVIALMVIVTAILLPTNHGYLLKRLLSIPTNVSLGIQLEDSAGSGRLAIWKQVVKLIPSNWAFGIGPDNLIYYGVHLGNTPVDKAHNIYLETAVTMGIPALLFYLAFLSFFIFRKCRTDKDFMFFSMISTYLIQGFFNIDVIMVLPLFWIVLGLYQGNIEEEKLMEVNVS